MREMKRDGRALAFILVVIFLDTLGLGIIIPVMPDLMVELTGQDLGGAARYTGWLMFVYAAMQFLFAPVIGGLSDRFGRRPVLLASVSGLVIDYLIMGFAHTVWLLFLGRILSGIAGASFVTANAYVADVSPPEKRAANFGFVSAAWGVGFMLGPVIGGLVGEFGARMPFFAAAGMSGLTFFYGVFVLPESLAVSNRRPFQMHRSNPVGAIVQVRRFPVVVGLLVSLLFLQIAHDSLPSTWTYYTKLKFEWTPRDIGISLGVIGIMIILVNAVLIQRIMPVIGEKRAVYYGLPVLAAAYLGYSVASSGWMMLAFIVPFALGGIGLPAIRGIMANQVPDNAQGELQGAVTSMLSITEILAPLMMMYIFYLFSEPGGPAYFPGAPFLTASLMVVIAVVWAMVPLARIE